MPENSDITGVLPASNNNWLEELTGFYNNSNGSTYDLVTQQNYRSTHTACNFGSANQERRVM